MPTASRESATRWATLCFLVWIGGASILLARVFAAGVHLTRLKGRSRPFEAGSKGLHQRWLAEHCPGRPVSLRVSPDISVPMAAGFIRPVVLLPEGLAGRLAHDELEQVILHELAHLRRRDDWTNLVQKVVEGALFFHPAVIWIGRRLNLEREIACDDWVVSWTRSAKPYALCLTRLMETAVVERQPVLAPGALRKGHQLSRRIEMLLDTERDFAPRLRKLALVTAGALLAGGVALSARVAPVVAAQKKLVLQEALEARFVPAPGAETPSSTEAPLPREAQEPQARPQPSSSETETPLTEGEDKQDTQEDRVHELEASNDPQTLERERRLAPTRAAATASVARLAAVRQGGWTQEPESEPTITTDELLPLLVEIARNDTDSEVRQAALSQLVSAGGDSGAQAMIEIYEDSDDLELKQSILAYLTQNATPTAVEKLKSVARSDPHAELRLLAVRYLGALTLPGKNRLLGLYVDPPAPVLAPHAPILPHSPVRLIPGPPEAPVKPNRPPEKK